jgi:hypothetical protein
MKDARRQELVALKMGDQLLPMMWLGEWPCIAIRNSEFMSPCT